jgi:large subunit ribosomal protein L24
MIYRATYTTKSKQLGSALSKDLHKKYGKRSVRVIEGDSIKIVRGEFKGVDGKISKISTQKSSVSIEGIKKEKTKGDKFDVHIHTSNLVVTSLNTGDKWRMAKLEGKDPKKQSKEELKEKPVKEELKEKPVKEELKEKPVKEELKEKPVKDELVKKVSKETKEVKKTEKKEDEK